MSPNQEAKWRALLKWATLPEVDRRGGEQAHAWDAHQQLAGRRLARHLRELTLEILDTTP